MNLPEFVRMRLASEGEAGQRWLDELPALVAELENTWQIQVGDPLEGGTESLVAPATLADGTIAILKIGVPSHELSSELCTLQLANGRGYAKLLAVDESRNVLLVEKLGNRLATTGLSIKQQIEIICQTLKTAWLPLDEPHGLMTGADKAQWLATAIQELWHELKQPCQSTTITQVLAFAEARIAAHNPANCVLVHGDAHAHNTLQVEGEDGVYKFIDPDGLFAEPAYDLAIPMREWSDEVLAGDALKLGQARCALLSELTGIDETAIWQWGFLETVSTGLFATKIGMEEGKKMLAVADAWATAG